MTQYLPKDAYGMPITHDPIPELQAEVRRLGEIVRCLQPDPLVKVTGTAESALPVELPAHWRALAQILRNLADRIVHMTSTDRGHLLNRLNDADWIVDKRGEWMCIVCDRLELEHDFDCPVKALETLMKVHGGVL